MYYSNLTLEEYKTFVCEPKHSVNPNRDIVLFDYDFMDKFLSKTPWYAIPIAWTPIILYFLYLNELSLIATVVLILGGIF